MAQLTLLQKASAFIRNFQLETQDAISAFAHGMVNHLGDTVIHGADGHLTLTLGSGKALKGWTQALRNALQNIAASSPSTGGTVHCNSAGLDDIQYWTPAGTIATQTYVFPTDAASQLGQIIELTSTQIVTALTITSSGLTLKGSAVTALAVNTPVRWRKVAASTWLRLA